MSKAIKQLKDKAGLLYYPATTTEAIVDRTRRKGLNVILDDMEEAINNAGTEGKEGKSAYEIWLEQGNSGTEQDFLDSLKGADAVIDLTKIATIEYVDSAIRSSIIEIINTPV